MKKITVEICETLIQRGSHVEEVFYGKGCVWKKMMQREACEPTNYRVKVSDMKWFGW